MSTIEKSYWEEVIEMLKGVKYSHFHLWYSSKDGWTWVSYKSKRKRIDSTYTLFAIKEVLNSVMIG